MLVLSRQYTINKSISNFHNLFSTYNNNNDYLSSTFISNYIISNPIITFTESSSRTKNNKI